LERRVIVLEGSHTVAPVDARTLGITAAIGFGSGCDNPCATDFGELAPLGAGA
jgi:hypothetical protein